MPIRAQYGDFEAFWAFVDGPSGPGIECELVAPGEGCVSYRWCQTCEDVIPDQICFEAAGLLPGLTISGAAPLYSEPWIVPACNVPGLACYARYAYSTDITGLVASYKCDTHIEVPRQFHFGAQIEFGPFPDAQSCLTPPQPRLSPPSGTDGSVEIAIESADDIGGVNNVLISAYVGTASDGFICDPVITVFDGKSPVNAATVPPLCVVIDPALPTVATIDVWLPSPDRPCVDSVIAPPRPCRCCTQQSAILGQLTNVSNCIALSDNPVLGALPGVQPVSPALMDLGQSNRIVTLAGQFPGYGSPNNETFTAIAELRFCPPDTGGSAQEDVVQVCVGIYRVGQSYPCISGCATTTFTCEPFSVAPVNITLHCQAAAQGDGPPTVFDFPAECCDCPGYPLCPDPGEGGGGGGGSPGKDCSRCPPPRFECVNGFCIYNPVGEFPDLQSCERNCIPLPVGDCCPELICFDGSVVTFGAVEV